MIGHLRRAERNLKAEIIGIAVAGDDGSPAWLFLLLHFFLFWFSYGRFASCMIPGVRKRIYECYGHTVTIYGEYIRYDPKIAILTLHLPRRDCHSAEVQSLRIGLRIAPTGV